MSKRLFCTTPVILAVGLFVPAVLAAQGNVIVTSAAVEDYSASPYILHVTGQNFGKYVPIVLWQQQPRVVTEFTPSPDG